jgi:DNA modification methylase
VHSSKLIHQNEKPVGLIKKLIETCSYNESLILDPFGGSGVTAEACFETGRRYVVIERDPATHKKILERLK